MIWRSQVLLSVKKGKKRRCLNWTKVGLKVAFAGHSGCAWKHSAKGCENEHLSRLPVALPRAALVDLRD